MRISVAFTFLAVALGGCTKGPTDSPTVASDVPQASDEAMPQSVSVPGGDATLGTRIGSEHPAAEVASFRISKFAITVGQWKTCIEAGACVAPEFSGGACVAPDPDDPGVDGPTFARGADDIPVTCVSLAQASRFCEYAHHGHVPTIAELLTAIRGPSPRRFPWGDQRAGCQHRWRLSFATDVAGACCGHDCADPTGMRLGLHAAGDSPFGVSDVLSTHAELAASGPASPMAACRGENGCVVAGMEPGAIDWVFPLGSYEEPTGEKSSPYAGGFRCAWTGEVTP